MTDAATGDVPEIDRDVEIDESDWLVASNKIEGTTVYNEDGDKLGTIHNFMVDKLSGQVEYAVLTFGGLFGLGADYYPLPWDSLTYDTDQDGYIVDIDKEMLEKAPRYGAGEEPSFDRAYAEQLHSYYGVAYP